VSGLAWLQRAGLHRVKPWLPWIKRAVFLLVLIGLFGATKQATQRWQNETAAIAVQVADLQRRAATESGPVAAALTQEAAKRQAALPSLANVRWDRVIEAGILYSLGLLLPGLILHRCLAAFAVPCTLRRAIAAQYLGHAGKYVPGKAMVIVLRVGAILPAQQIPARIASEKPPANPPRPVGRVTSCIFFETLLMMGVGSAVAGILLWSSPLPVWVRGLAALMAIGSVVPLCPPILRRLIVIIAARKQTNDDSFGATRTHVTSSESNPATITWPLLAGCWLISMFSWLFIGFSFAILITAIPSFELLPPLSELAPVATAAISLGMVLGFVSLLPGGAGVREYVTLLVLVPVIGQTHALLAVIAARLLFIIIESLCAGLSVLYLRRLHFLQPIPPG
jgi:hypothetical protein